MKPSEILREAARLVSAFHNLGANAALVRATLTLNAVECAREAFAAFDAETSYKRGWELMHHEQLDAFNSAAAKLESEGK